MRDELKETRVEIRALCEAPLNLVETPELNGEGSETDKSESESDESKSIEALQELKLLKTLFAQLPREIAIPNEAPLPAEAETPLSLSGIESERLTAHGGAATPMARVSSAMRDLSDMSDYRQHMVSGEPIPAFAREAAGSVSAPQAVGWSLPHDRAAGARILAATRDALERARVTLFVQPIVSLPNRRVRFYEAFSRIRAEDGTLITPEQYLDIAAEAGLIAAIDNNLLFRCVQLMRRLRQHDRTYGFFCNISPHTLRDETFFPQFVDFLADNATLANDLIFEFTQADVETQYDAVTSELERLARLGYRFSLDHATRSGLNFKGLAARHFRHVKLDVSLMLELAAESDGGARIERMLSDATNAGVSLVIEKIETERDLIELLDHPFPFGQG
jgi:cyclic-di-GMP phosphodiesterase TipF (flagellum assembly factor)